MNGLTKLLRSNVRQYAMVVALAVIIIIFQITTGGILLKPLNITNVILQNSYVFVLSIGMLLCLITGNVDLSVGSVVAFVGAVSGILNIQMGWGAIPTFIVSMLVGLLIGMWQGFWIAYAKIPAFIATLAGMLIFRGLTMVVLKGQTVSPFSSSYQVVSAAFLNDPFAGGTVHILTLIVGAVISAVYIAVEIRARLRKKQYGFKVPHTGVFACRLAAVALAVNAFCFGLSLYKGIPNVFIVIGALILLYTFILKKTIAGRHIYAYGGNAKAAMLSGVKTQQVLFWVYANMSLLSAVAGIVFSGRLNAVTPKAGAGFEMDAIAACCIGGASASGGVGTVLGAVVGGLIMGILNNGMSLMGISVDWQQTIKGIVLLLAVSFDVYTKTKAKAS